MWGSLGSRIVLTDFGSTVGSVDVTSTSTVYCAGTSGGAFLRIFDVGASTLAKAFDDLKRGYVYNGSDTATTIYEPAGETWMSYVRFLDSDSSFEFIVDSGGATTTQTGIPNMKFGENWSYESVNSSTQDASGYWIHSWSTETADMIAWYKDGCVVKVPASIGNGWLFILVRGRVPTAKIAEDNPGTFNRDPWGLAEFVTDYREPGAAIVDLVVYYTPGSPSGLPRFDQANTKGPFLLVHSLHALSDPDLRDRGVAVTDAGFRCWLGVPGAVFIGDDLYLYYVASASRNDATRADWVDPDPRFDECVAAYNGGAGFSETTVFRLIHGINIKNWIIDATPTDERNWTMADAVPGEHGLPIRPWMAVQGSASREVKDVSEVALDLAAAALASGATAYAHTTARVADPIPMSDGTDLALAYALRPSSSITIDGTANLLFGVIRGAAIPSGETVDWGGTAITCEFGRDFVSAFIETSSGESRDQVAWSWCDTATLTVYDFMDPDATWNESVLLWTVAANDQNDLIVFEAPTLVVESAWDDAWRMSWWLSHRPSGTWRPG